jgi:DNA-binding LytR/AlgR family response regulator
MHSQPLASISALGRAAVTRPLNRRETIVAALILQIGGTAYCAAYCRIAFYPMHAGAMPLWLSAWWAATSLLPWLAAFEALKRLRPRIPFRPWLIAASLAIAIITAGVTVAAYWLTDIDMMKMSASHWPMLIATQMQPVFLFVCAVVLWLNLTAASTPADAPGADTDAFPALSSIDWIRAAGNYVELKCGGRLLIRRMTMRSAEEATRSADFIRIHRSIIVRRSLVTGFAGRSQLRLATGETMPVGDSYRASVERIVTSSQDSPLRPIGL